MRLHAKRREATTLVEFAIICPVLFLLLLGLVIGAAGMFRYQETAHLARKAARYAAVHGKQWAKDTGNTAPTPADIYNTVIKPNAVILDTTKITYSITYNTSNDTAHEIIVNGQVTPVTNTVTVTVNYQWVPESFLGRTITLSSTSVMPMSY
jgi:Flp pilus assembly protein TadG